MLSKLKQVAARLFEGQARLAYRLGLRPNHISALGLLSALLASLAYWLWHEHFLFALSAPFLALLSGYSDLLDGLVARL
ncbi:hypothetical protein DRO33_01000, partial [Candidatus Bathyarchaeota archaeon]